MSSETQYIFSCDMSQLEGKQGKLQKVGEDRYEILVGAFNAYNNSGRFYEFTKRVGSLFSGSTWMMQQLRDNKLWGECDHPSPEQFMGKPNWKDLWFDRLREVRAANAANHYSLFRLENLPRQERGQTVVGVFAHVKPVKEEYRAGLLDPTINLCHSVRSFINRRMEGFTEIAECKEILTYDWVTFGGKPLATKYNTPGLESASGGGRIITDLEITPSLLAAAESRDMHRLVAMREAGLESAPMIDVTRIRDHLGKWRDVPTFDVLGPDRRASRQWGK